jgi:hypothetical protein
MHLYRFVFMKNKTTYNYDYKISRINIENVSKLKHT